MELCRIASAPRHRSRPLKLKRAAAGSVLLLLDAAATSRQGQIGLTTTTAAASVAAMTATFSTKAALASKISPPPPQRFTYAINVMSGGTAPSTATSALYVPLTSRCNSRTLPSTRGPGFVLPSDTVAALCRVRDAENEYEEQQQQQRNEPLQPSAETSDSHNQPSRQQPPKPMSRPKWEPWCQWLDTVDYPQKLPTCLDPVLRLAGEEEFEMAGDDADYRDSERQLRRSRRRPTADELWEEILPRIQQDPSVQVVFAGEGEPLLRLPTLLDLVRRVRKETDGQSTIRVTTNGLLPEAPSSSLSVVERDEQAMGAVAMAEIAAARRLAEAGVQCLSVALMTSDPDQYDEIMRPVVRIDNDGDPRRAHERACDMIRAGIKTGLQVEITAVEGPGVSKSALERFASSMFSGTAHAAAVPVRWRTYFA